MATVSRSHPADARQQSVPLGPYTREVFQREVTFTCQACGRTYTQVRFPGPTPRYCNELCRLAARRLLTAERMSRLRARRKAAAHDQTSDADHQESVT